MVEAFVFLHAEHQGHHAADGLGAEIGFVSRGFGEPPHIEYRSQKQGDAAHQKVGAQQKPDTFARSESASF